MNLQPSIVIAAVLGLSLAVRLPLIVGPPLLLLISTIQRPLKCQPSKFNQTPKRLIIDRLSRRLSDDPISLAKNTCVDTTKSLSAERKLSQKLSLENLTSRVQKNSVIEGTDCDKNGAKPILEILVRI